MKKTTLGTVREKKNKKQVKATIAVFEEDGDSERADLVLSTRGKCRVHRAYNA